MACDRVLGETLPACTPRRCISKYVVGTNAHAHLSAQVEASSMNTGCLYHHPQVKPCTSQEGHGPPRAQGSNQVKELSKSKQRKHHSPRQMLARKPVPRYCWAHQRLWRLQRQRQPPEHCCHWSGLWQWPAADRSLFSIRTIASERSTFSWIVCPCVGCSEASPSGPSAGGNVWAPRELYQQAQLPQQQAQAHTQQLTLQQHRGWRGSCL